MDKVMVEHSSSMVKMTEEIRVIKTILHAPPVVMKYINRLVLATSEIETRANAIYTLAILTANEEEKEGIPSKMFDQSFMTACMRSAACTTEVQYKCDASKSYLLRARRDVPQSPRQTSLSHRSPNS